MRKGSVGSVGRGALRHVEFLFGMAVTVRYGAFCWVIVRYAVLGHGLARQARYGLVRYVRVRMERSVGACHGSSGKASCGAFQLGKARLVVVGLGRRGVLWQLGHVMSLLV